MRPREDDLAYAAGRARFGERSKGEAERATAGSPTLASTPANPAPTASRAARSLSATSKVATPPLRRLLDMLPPTPETPLWFAGDLIYRGPDALVTLRKVVGFGSRAHAVLGNHDLHLLAVDAGIRKIKHSDMIAEILQPPRCMSAA